MQVIDNTLKDYQDVHIEDIEMVEEANENPFLYLTHTYMHNTHHTLVPIGANFQVLIPPVLTQNAYRVKSAEMMNSLQKLKINDPEQGG